jgi:hypothetical protein
VSEVLFPRLTMLVELRRDLFNSRQLTRLCWACGELPKKAGREVLKSIETLVAAQVPKLPVC